MAVTVEYSTQLARLNTTPVTANSSTQDAGKVRIQEFNFTQGAAAGDATSTQILCAVPAGARILPQSYIRCSAFGAARTLSVGKAAYIDGSSTPGTAVNAAAATFISAADVSAACMVPFGTTLGGTAGGALLTGYDVPTAIRASGPQNLEGKLVIYSTVAVDTIPAGATINGIIYYTQE